MKRKHHETDAAAARQPSKAALARQRDEEAIAKLASEHWPEIATGPKPEVVKQLYTELRAKRFPQHKVSALEFSLLLENLLWPTFTADCGHEHLMCMVLMVNEKFLEGHDPWVELCAADKEQLLTFFETAFTTCANPKDLSYLERKHLNIFLIRCFQSLEHEVMREFLQPYISLNTWHALLPEQRQEQFEQHPRLAKGWKKLLKRLKKMPDDEQTVMLQKHLFVYDLIKGFFAALESITADAPDRHAIAFCERFLELLVDIEALLTTRRYLNTVVRACNVVSVCRLSALFSLQDRGHLFRQLTEMLEFYVGFEIDDFTGEPLTDDMMTARNYDEMHRLQRAAFQHFRERLQDFAFSHVSGINTRQALVQYLERLDDDRLRELCAHMCIGMPTSTTAEEEAMGGPTVRTSTAHMSRELMTEVLCSRFTRRQSQLDELNEMPLFPTEKLLWDENLVPTDLYRNQCLALPKLNLQFLTLFDYLLRNLKLFNMESLYEIRLDLEDHLPRLRPYTNAQGIVSFGGWSRMALPVQDFAVVEVAAPHIGFNHPSSVRADMTVTLDMASHIRREWESLRKHDVGFLISLHPPMLNPAELDTSLPFPQQFGVVAVRGCEIEGMLDARGQLVEERPDVRPQLPRGNSRTFRLILDPNQYQLDLDAGEGGTDLYSTFNVFVRRNPKENNFKAVLETIRDLMNTRCVVPDWLHDIFLGYGDPAAAHYSNISSQLAHLNFNDTFLSLAHVRAAFPKHDVVYEGGDGDGDDGAKAKPPFALTFPVEMPERKIDTLVPRNVAKKGKAKPKATGDAMDVSADGGDGEKRPVLRVQSLHEENRGPFPQDAPKRNAVPFTAAQVEAIHSGMQPGLTLVVGPPGTGKTDVAVQTISNLYHNHPDQRTLIVTHSNQALNQLFEKLIHLDIEERHLLRLGRGEELLETTKDFSRYGRVDFVLQHRLELLEEVQRLAASLQYPIDVASTCETCAHFHRQAIQPLWTAYADRVQQQQQHQLEQKQGGDGSEALAMLAAEFPFAAFFSTAPQPLFHGRSFDEDWEMALGCMRHLNHVFETLREYRPFEQVHRGRDRSKYLLTKEAKIVAMTCTHAALTRSELVKLGFKYDNVVMEEAAQILEVETFIPLMLQNTEDGYNRLKRVMLIGDHHQLPPVIKNTAFKKFSNMEQSLFTRFVRLGVPHVLLDKQGRMRPSLANLFRWNYEGLGDLPHVESESRFSRANPGFKYDFQLVDVGDFRGVGESVPSPHFIQNLAEAEYVVAVYMYMRLLGYPASRITILTTYNGQKDLLHDVVRARCASHPLFGSPSKIETVDKYQGSQNDYVLLSLVRTRSIGFMRDVRRMVVAMSRARLGLYVFARASLFSRCKELEPIFSQLTARPTSLMVYPNEVYGQTDRDVGTQPEGAMQVLNMPHMAQSVYKMAMEKVQSLAATMPAPPVADETAAAAAADADADTTGEAPAAKAAKEGPEEAEEARTEEEASEAAATGADMAEEAKETAASKQAETKQATEEKDKEQEKEKEKEAQPQQEEVKKSRRRSSKGKRTPRRSHGKGKKAAAAQAAQEEEETKKEDESKAMDTQEEKEEKEEKEEQPVEANEDEDEDEDEDEGEEAVTSGEKSPDLTMTEVNKMRVVDLKAALKERDIEFPSSARKKELKQILVKALGL
ncbi:aqr protein [Salpingoeca rosetta]|uniref:Aqr protein n=1 Tax=Salpingoeca rosetta (strain ATCC 50818 / BSB-021) TaxID=946362 RepID=F2UAF5_SALR5|nr:aqr protein [Salpingoeca rosetta]EGD73730.1 aqr protein [Salpingoeca rosetta]|eukprot:XP_004994011.1 aqr protein [Salpingoeca rosetta]